MYIIDVFNTNYLQNNIKYQLNKYDKNRDRRIIFMRLLLQSVAFKDGGTINKKYTCDGENISPPLSGNYESKDVKSFAILCEDHDAHDKLTAHWIIFNIPKDIQILLTGLSDMKIFSKGVKEGINSFGKIGYDGPCPPKNEEHRYFFRIYALDTLLDLKWNKSRTFFECYS